MFRCFVAMLFVVCVASETFAHGFAVRSRNVVINRNVVRAPLFRHRSRSVNIVRQRNVFVPQQVFVPVREAQCFDGFSSFGSYQRSGFDNFSFQRESFQFQSRGCADIFSY